MLAHSMVWHSIAIRVPSLVKIPFTTHSLLKFVFYALFDRFYWWSIRLSTLLNAREQWDLTGGVTSRWVYSWLMFKWRSIGSFESESRRKRAEDLHPIFCQIHRRVMCRLWPQSRYTLCGHDQRRCAFHLLRRSLSVQSPRDLSGASQQPCQ